MKHLNYALSFALLLTAPYAHAQAPSTTGEVVVAPTTIDPAEWSVDGASLSIQDAITIALDASPNVALQEAVQRITRLDVESVNTAYRPNISLSSSIETSTGAGYVIGSNQLSGDMTRSTATSFNVNLSASQLIWDFGVSAAQRRAARARISSTEIAAVQIERDIIYAVVQNYLNAGAALEQLKVAQSALEAETLRARQIEGYVQVGMRAPIDRANANANLANAEARVIEARMNYDLAVIDLRAAMGVIDDETPLRIEFEVFELQELETHSNRVLVQMALEQRGEFGEQSASEAAAREMLRAIRANNYPTLNAVAGVSDSLVIDQSNRWNAYIGIRFNWNLYGSGTVQVQRRQQEAELIRISAQTASIAQSVGADVRRASARIHAAKALVETHNARVANANTQLELAEGRYRNGLGDIVELTDAQQSRVEAEYNLISAELNLSLARASLVAAIAGW